MKAILNSGVFRSGLLAAALTLSGIGHGLAQNAAGPDMRCIQLSELLPQHAPPQLARSVRDCIARERYGDAMQVFLAYSTRGTFDQQRVKDVTGHAALVQLNVWIFAGYSNRVMGELRAVADKLRDRENDIFRATCAALVQAGPPDYRPTYLIARGMQPRKTDDDWKVEGFDAARAWHKSLVEVNHCPDF